MRNVTTLKLTDSTIFDTGMAVLTYSPAQD
jgi:hypothetical protein